MHKILQKILRRPLCLVTVVYAIVAFLVQVFVSPPSPRAAQSFDSGQRILLTGQLYKKEMKNNRLIYYLKDVQIKENSSKIIQVENVMCYMSGDVGSEVSPDAPVGRWLYVQGEVLPFEPSENEGQFDALSYYEGIGISLRLWDTAVILQGSSYDMPGEGVVDIKQSVAVKFRRYMAPENAGVLSAMVLGDKSHMDGEVKNLYRKSGIAHILAISGLHISLLGMSLYRLLRRAYVPPQLCGVFGILFVAVYIKFSGFSISSFRAVCMFVMFMGADLLGRSYDLLTALAFSALLLLIDNPSAMFEAGFLLSYFAVLGLAVVLPVLKSNVPWKAADAFLPGFSVQILIFPITLWFYYEFPLYSFLLNLIVVPCMSVVLFSGILGAVPGFGFVLYVPDLLLCFYEWLCRRTELLPGAVIVTGRPAVWQVVLYYVLVLVWLIFCAGRGSGARGDAESSAHGGAERGALGGAERGVLGAAASWRLVWRGVFRVILPLLFMVLFLFPVHRENRVDMLSVGQGDCFVMRDDSGKVVLLDGGSTDVAQVGKYRLLPFLKYHGISEVDVAFLSHAHEDHYSAIAELLEEGVRIKTLCLTGYAEGVVQGDYGGAPVSAPGAYAEIILLAKRAGCEVVFVNPGDSLICGDMRFDCVFPDVATQVSDENDSSMVLLARLADFSMLFTGDSTMSCDEEVIRRLRLLGVTEIDCLKVAHHGAATSTSAQLLEVFDFKAALISCGQGNSYGHPHKALLSRLEDAGCAVFVTADDGQVTVRICEGNLKVKKFGKE